MAKPFLPETLNKIDKFSALWPEKEKKKKDKANRYARLLLA